MSYDLAVWEGPPSADDSEALVTHRQLLDRWQDEGVVEAIRARMRGEKTAYDPTSAIEDYVVGWSNVGLTSLRRYRRGESMG
jgi:hypothetical protein